MKSPRILLIVGGGIAAYKACELVRLARKADIAVSCVLTKGGSHFVTPMALAALSENPVHTSLWDLKNEVEMGHIQLSRQADLIVVAPATADFLAKMAAGIADDLATTLLLATDAPVLVAPAMNVRMWGHPATQRNVARLREDGINVLEPDEGEMACGEFGAGRLPEPDAILAVIRKHLSGGDELIGQPDFAADLPRPLAGKRVLVTAGPTHEPIDPVRYLANRSSGRQGFAIAAEAARAGGDVTLIAGPVELATPAGVTRIDVETADQMAMAVEKALPADIAFMVAAVADWRPDAAAGHKIKKSHNAAPSIVLAENPDLLAHLGQSHRRPQVLVGFAAETRDLVANARAKLVSKGADWIVANDVSGSTEASAMGGDDNAVHIVTANEVESWVRQSKVEVARRLVAKAAQALLGSTNE